MIHRDADRMPNSHAFVEHVLETMRPATAVTARAMFGGHGIYVDGRMCALIAALRAAATRPAAKGARARTRRVLMPTSPRSRG